MANQRGAVPMTRRQVFLPDDVWAWLNHQAICEGISTAEKLRKIVEASRARKEAIAHPKTRRAQ